MALRGAVNMENEVKELKKLLVEFEQARLPTSKASIAEKTLKILVPVVIHQQIEINELKMECNQCQI